MLSVGKLALIPIGGIAAFGIIDLFSPSGPLPWPLPVLPSIEIGEVSELSLADPSHGAGYDDELIEIETRFDVWTEPIDAIASSLDDWLGGAGSLPDASEGDFETGLAPIEEYGTAYEFADEAGTSIGALFIWARALVTMSQSGVGAVGLFVLACSVWLVLVRLIIFAIQISDATWSLLTRLASVFADYFIPW